MAMLRSDNQARWALAMVLLLLAVPFLVWPLAGHAQQRSEFNLVLVGDSMITQPISLRKDEPRIMAVVDAIRQGDASFTNLELTFAGREAPPDELGGNRGAGGTWMASDPSMLKELQWMGFNLFNAANNHSLDYGIEGLRDTMRVLSEGGAAYAGIGENLGDARAPGYLATRHGRVALVSCASTITPGAAAGQSRPDARGRPGLNPLRFQTRYRVNAATLETLRKVKAEFKLPGGRGESRSSETVTLRLDSSDATFEVGDEPGVVTAPDPRDLEGLLHSIRDAREMADYVVTYIHAHEAAPAGREIPAQFLVEFAHAAVDAGADVFVASGPHVLRGIEIYKGKVIFYSLANFIYQYDLVRFLPADLYENLGLGPEALPSEADDARSDHDRHGIPADSLLWQSVIAHVVFQSSKLAQVILTPITLGFGKKRSDRGYPEVADPSTATTILERVQKLSQAFGTNIAIKDGIGTITIEADSRSQDSAGRHSGQF